MRDLIEFRIPERYAALYLPPNEGKTLGGSVRILEVSYGSERFRDVGRFDQELKRQGRAFFTAWNLKRSYTTSELESAQLFSLKIRSVFEPAGEECGTQYDESAACQYCGSGAKQISRLFLNQTRIPKFKDICKTIGSEVVVSKRLVELFKENRIQGVEFLPIGHNRSSSAQSSHWFQLVISSAETEIVSPTRTGIDPFDNDCTGRFRCPLGDLAGLNILSELFVNLPARLTDVLNTRQFIGRRQGLLRPERLIVISNKVWRLLESEKLKGWMVEKAHAV
jgi:hypothetical protein